MNRSVIGWVVALLLAIGGSALAWVWFAGGSGEPSTELTTPAIVDSATTTLGDNSEGDEVTFVIDSSQTVVTFEIDELLQGSPNHVVGITDQVAGQIALDLSDLSTAQFSEIVVNARTFKTDSERRDRAIRGPIILNTASDQFELINFVVEGVSGLTGAAEPGDVMTFSLMGSLTIKGVTSDATFAVEANLVDESTIDGFATTTVLRSDFGIGIPGVPGVVDVSDEVVLSINFVAVSG
jgi:polyisoprenoid-binding protein YceI